MLSHGHQYPLFPMAAPGVVRAEMVNPHERLSVRTAARVAKTSCKVVVMVAASGLPRVMDRRCVGVRGRSVIQSLPM